MKNKPIKIDWDELEEAFDSRDPEVAYYLDRITGHVVLEGEGEEKSFKADESRYNRGEQSAPSHPEDATRAYIPTVTSEQKLEWVSRFAAEAAELDAGVRSDLAAALERTDPVPEVLGILNTHPEVKESWYLFRAERLHEAVERWVEEQGIAVSTPPPWR